jgi:hypothetical protein
VRFDVRAVQRHLLGRLRRSGYRLEDLLPDSAHAPAIEAIVHRRIWAIFRRTVLSSTAGLQHMDDPAQNPSVVLRLRTRAMHWNERLDLRPLRVIQPKQVRSHQLAPPIRQANPLNLNIVN